MKGWQIFRHSLQLVLNNLDAALKVSALLYLFQVANQVLLYLNPPETMTEGIVPVYAPDTLLQTFVLSLAAIVASLWIAVAWHRFVLAEEHPRGLVPRWHGSNMLSYLGRSIMIGLMVLLAVLLATIPAGLIAAFAPGLSGLVALGFVGLAAYLFFRLGVMLPAAAMGRSMGIGEAWRETRDEDGAILVLALLVIGASLLLMLPSMVGGGGTLIDLVYQIVTGWFATIIGISVLTTLYGHYVEGRPID